MMMANNSLYVEATERVFSIGFDLFRTSVHEKKSILGKIPGIYRSVHRVASTIGADMYTKIEGSKLYSLILPTKILNYTDAYEPKTSALFRSLIKDGMTFLDIGSSLGYFTLLASSRVGHNGTIWSFECDRARFETLKKSIRANKWDNVHAVNVAVSDVMGNGTISIDAFLQDQLYIDNVDLVKIDVDGMEVEVLNGMKKILSKGTVNIICEVTPSLIASFGYSATDITDILNRYGYNIYLMPEKMESELSLATGFADKPKNYLFTRKSL